jgi:hypothetical protein
MAKPIVVIKCGIMEEDAQNDITKNMIAKLHDYHVILLFDDVFEAPTVEILVDAKISLLKKMIIKLIQKLIR